MNLHLTKTTDITAGLISQAKYKYTWHIVWVVTAVLLFAISIYINWYSWGPNALFNDDTHREFVTPVRLAAGEVLYKDFNFLYGPLPQYINAFLLYVPLSEPFTNLRTIALLLFITNIVLLWLLCKNIDITLFFGPMLLSLVCWTNGYTFNPTSFNGLYSSVFATFGILCAIMTVGNIRRWPWVGLGVAVAITFLSKPEGLFTVGLACMGAMLVKYKESRQLPFKQGLFALLGFLIIVIPSTAFLLSKGLNIGEITEGILQHRFQANLNSGFIAQFGYFYGTNGIRVIALGASAIASIFVLFRLLEKSRTLSFYTFLFIGAIITLFLFYNGSLYRLTDDYINLGSFFGVIAGFWWYQTIPDSSTRDILLIYLIASLGGWLRPLIHVGAIVIPFYAGGGILLATVFVFLMLPSLYQRLFNGRYELAQKGMLLIGSIAVILYAWTGVHKNWAPLWQQHTLEVETQFGKVTANSNDLSTQNAMAAIDWLKKNLPAGKRIVALEGLPIELSLGWLPCIPLSQLNYQVYEGDAEKIIHIFDTDTTVAIILVPIRHGGYHFGVQDYQLADYLDAKWKIEARFNVPSQLIEITKMSPQRKMDTGLKHGILLYSRKSL